MKKFTSILTLGVLWMLAANVCAQGITTPRTASPAAIVSQTIGISTVTIKYSRPSVNNRAIWGALVPFGWNVQSFGPGNPAPWRAGANENTVIEFSHDVKIEGQSVPKGSYGLFFTIEPDNKGEVILSKDFRSWGSFFYDAKQDQLRAKIQLREIPHTEMLTYDFINVKKSTAEMVLNWEKKQFPVSVEFDVDNIVMKNAADELKGPVGFSAQSYLAAAEYALQNNVNLEQALKWTDQAISQNRNFAALRTKSALLKKNGNTAEADKLMAEAIGMANERDLNTYGYQLMGENELDKAIEILTLNTQRFPKSANTWDSLGEAYATKGDKANAIKNFKKSLSLNPPAGVKANSEKFLKQLGAL